MMIKTLGSFLSLILLATTLTVGSSSSSTSAGISTVVDYFDKTGFLVLRNQFRDWQLQNWQTFAEEYFNAIFVHLYEQGHTSFPAPTINGVYSMTEGWEHGFNEIVMSSPGRYELLLDNNAAHPPIDFIKTQLSELMPALLHSADSDMEDLQVQVSMVVTTPNAPAENNWHWDGDHLDLEQHQPCHGLNIIIPLTDITATAEEGGGGSTELFPGSHVVTRELQAARSTTSQMNLDTSKLGGNGTPFAPSLNVGDVYMWDLRTLHRGMANGSSNQNQPILVLTFAQPSLTYEHNWPDESVFDKKYSKAAK